MGNLNSISMIDEIRKQIYTHNLEKLEQILNKYNDQNKLIKIKHKTFNCDESKCFYNNNKCICAKNINCQIVKNVCI